MKKAKKELFVPSTCVCCSQTTNYAMSLDRGTVHIVLAIYNAVRRLGRNRVHLDNEMVVARGEYGEYRDMVESGYMTNSMRQNVLRARYHGLVAFADKGSGEYLITPKGVAFLRGEPVLKTVIVDKLRHKNDGYFEPDGSVTLTTLLKKEPYWAKAYGNDLDEVTGRFLSTPQAVLAV